VIQAKRRFDELGDAFYNSRKFREETLAGGEELQKINEQFEYLSKNFATITEVQQAQSDVVGQLIFQNSEHVNQMDTVTLRKIPAYSKAMGISSTEVAGMIERNIVLNGEATTSMLDNVVAYSDSIARRTGLDMKQLQQESVKVLNNIKQFGPLTEAEATKMTATLMQMGIKMESFAAVQGKFQDFGGAASAAGDISQLTGGQVMLDAQEMMYLASEDPVEMMTTLRKRFLEAGFDREQFLSMTKMDQKALSSQLGMSFEEITMMLDRTKPLTEEAIKTAQAAADESTDLDKFGKVTDQLSEIENAFNSHDKMMKRARERRFFEQREAAYNAAGDLADAENKFRRSLEIPGLDDSAIEKQFEGIEKAAARLERYTSEIKIGDAVSMDGIVEGVHEVFGSVFDITKGGVDSMVEVFKKGIDPLTPKSLPKVYEPVVEGLEYLQDSLNKNVCLLENLFLPVLWKALILLPRI